MGLIFFSYCTNLAIHGPNTISKSDTEKNLQQIVFTKGVSCGLRPEIVYSFSEFANPSSGVVILGMSKDKTAKNILYEKKAVENCYNSLLLMPCPPPSQELEEREQNFLFIAMSTLILSCTFDTIDFFEFKKFPEGRFF